MSTILYNAPDYYLTDELLTDEHRTVRKAVRDWVNRAVIPIIDDACQKHELRYRL